MIKAAQIGRTPCHASSRILPVDKLEGLTAVAAVQGPYLQNLGKDSTSIEPMILMKHMNAKHQRRPTLLSLSVMQ